MPAIGSKLTLSAAASSSGLAIADINLLKGSFYTVASKAVLLSIPINRIENDQIVWVEGESATYQATITPANPPISFSDSSSWAVFTGFGSGGGGATNIGDLTDVSTASLDDGDVLAWNASSSSWVPTNVAGTGDISAVFAGDGLTGGGTQGSVSLDVSAGNGISLTGGSVTLNTGSSHFISAVQNLSDTSIFSLTGSDYATTNNIQITGSLTLQLDTAGDTLAIYSGSDKKFSITNEGILRLVTQSSTPTAVEGGMYLDSNYDLYIGQE